jgi:predicted Zn-dependent peptidase
VGCSAFLERGPGFLLLDCTLPPENLDLVEAGIFEELEALRRGGPTPREMQKARNRAQSAFVFNQETVEGIGRTLGHFEMLGDHTLADLYVRQLAGIRGEEVLEACRLYLRRERCSVVRNRPPRVGAAS